MFRLEERTLTTYGPCEFCGDISLLASGLVRRDEEPYAAYQVHWTKNQIALIYTFNPPPTGLRRRL